ncbi:MAG: hypothetical protein GY772_19490, partial [bacterium]|nr:hypothetical protein [bacterium]
DGLAARFHMEGAYANALDRLGVPILPEHAVSSVEFASRPIGSGPYRAIRGRRSVRFVAADNGARIAPISIINLQPMGDDYVAVRTFLADGVSGFIGVPPQLLVDVQTADSVVAQTPTHRIARIDLPSLPQPIRQAIAASVDHHELARMAWGNAPVAHTTGPFHVTSPWVDGEQVDLHPRPMAAAIFLEEVGAQLEGGEWLIDGATIELQVAPGMGRGKDILETLLRQLRVAGFAAHQQQDSGPEPIVVTSARADERAPAVEGQSATAWADAPNHATAMAAAGELQDTVATDPHHIFLWTEPLHSAWREGTELPPVLGPDLFLQIEQWRFPE